MDVVLFLQNLRTGETFSFTIKSNKTREWFYRHDAFLTQGTYLLWAQSKFGTYLSPPSPQVKLNVDATAFQFGASRISYEVLYLIFSFLLFIISIALIIFILHHKRHSRRKHIKLMSEIRSAEESIRRGFAVLRRDIQAELAIVDKARLSKKLSEQEEKLEKQLLYDLEEVEKKIGREIWEIERTEQAG